MKYFRLHFFVQYASGNNGGCLYNIQSHKMVYITEENNELLQKAENNEPVDENDPFIRQLYDQNWGSFYDSKVIIEKTRIGAAKEYEEIATPRIVVNHAFIQVTNDCDGDCEFCDKDRKPLTKTRCKKWDNKDADPDKETLIGLYKDLKDLKCETVTFIGGDPLKEFERIQRNVYAAREAGIRRFTIYTNLNNLTDPMIDFIADNGIEINVQIIDLADDSTYTQIKGENVIGNIKRLTQKGINVIASILITKFNQDRLEDLVLKLKGTGVRAISNDFLYEEEYAPEKFKEEMYSKQFIEVTRNNISFLEKYNNCLFGKVSVNLAGDVTPCPMMNDYVIGNIKDDPIDKILAQEKYQNVIKMTKNETEKCSECAFRMNCVDCRSLEYAATDRINGVKYCKYVK